MAIPKRATRLMGCRRRCCWCNLKLILRGAKEQQYGFNSIFLLPVNLYGPLDHFDLDTSHVIPALIRKCLEAKACPDEGRKRCEGEIIAWGDGSATREFLYGSDAAECILLASERYNESAPVNLGSAYEISIKQLVETIARLTGFEGRIVWDTSKANGQPRRKLDTSRGKRFFGFEAQMAFEERLRRTIPWYCATRHAPMPWHRRTNGRLRAIENLKKSGSLRFSRESPASHGVVPISLSAN